MVICGHALRGEKSERVHGSLNTRAEVDRQHSDGFSSYTVSVRPFVVYLVQCFLPFCGFVGDFSLKWPSRVVLKCSEHDVPHRENAYVRKALFGHVL